MMEARIEPIPFYTGNMVWWTPGAIAEDARLRQSVQPGLRG